MDLHEWAKREIEIACKRERGNKDESMWDYGCACYESALKAFESLMKDGHSGCSIGITKNILVRLIEGKPLTPIEDTEDVWNEVTWNDGDYKTYQCKRMSSLFKDVYDNGTVKYHDNNSHYCVDIDDPHEVPYRSGLVRGLMDTLFPIAMPYYPDKAKKVYCETLLTDSKNGDFDTKAILYAVTPDCKKIDIYKYFKESDNGFVEITAEEYADRKRMHEARIAEATAEQTEVDK